jgi:hypothetical protein
LFAFDSGWLFKHEINQLGDLLLPTAFVIPAVANCGSVQSQARGGKKEFQKPQCRATILGYGLWRQITQFVNGPCRILLSDGPCRDAEP